MQFVYIIIVLAVCGVVWYMNIQRLKNTKAANQGFLAQHPDAAKVYLTSKALITSEAVVVSLVDGQTPQNFFEGGKSGFYVTPGTHSVDMSYTYNRPGILYKNVSESTGLVKKELVVEASTSYTLGFNRDANEFTFEIFKPA
jgi:hypothetical protein